MVTKITIIFFFPWKIKGDLHGADVVESNYVKQNDNPPLLTLQRGVTGTACIQ
jgi:hypothetical protein